MASKTASEQINELQQKHDKSRRSFLTELLGDYSPDALPRVELAPTNDDRINQIVRRWIKVSPADLVIPGPLHSLVALALALGLVRRVHSLRARALKLLLVAWLICNWVLATPSLGSIAAQRLENQYPSVPIAAQKPNADGAIIVLASGQLYRADGTPQPLLNDRGWARLRAAAALWRQIGGQVIVVGGPGYGIDDSLAGQMKRALSEEGIPENQILAIGGSRNTQEDLAAVSRALGHIEQPTRGPYWLVTSALHMPRSASVAQALGLPITPYPCDFRQLRQPTWRAWLPGNAPPLLWRDVLHESIGLIVYEIRGWRD